MSMQSEQLLVIPNHNDCVSNGSFDVRNEEFLVISKLGLRELLIASRRPEIALRHHWEDISR
jgi:hypothetical protein